MEGSATRDIKEDVLRLTQRRCIGTCTRIIRVIDDMKMRAEEPVKIKLRKCEEEIINKIVEGLDEAARRHNKKKLYWYVNKMRNISQFGFFPAKDRNRVTVNDKERIKERWVEHIDFVLNCDSYREI